MMKRSLIPVALAIVILTALSCANKQKDPEKVIQSYFAALQEQDFRKAHDFLSTASMVLVAESGQSMRFIPKPSYQLFERSYSRYDHIIAQDIKPVPDLSEEDKLAVFDVRASLKLTPTSQASIQMLRVFLAPDNSGDWYILTPAPPAVTPDTASGTPGE